MDLPPKLLTHNNQSLVGTQTKIYEAILGLVSESHGLEIIADQLMLVLMYTCDQDVGERSSLLTQLNVYIYITRHWDVLTLCGLSSRQYQNRSYLCFLANTVDVLISTTDFYHCICSYWAVGGVFRTENDDGIQSFLFPN